MKVTHVAIGASQAALLAGRPVLPPELMAACGARYSRNDEGLKAILSLVDPENPDASVDRIFKMMDYGHQSIADMATVSIFMDKISIWLAYLLWSVCPTAGGQESSTRYIKLSAKHLPDPGLLGIPDTQVSMWQTTIEEAFDAYNQALVFWETLAQKQPELLRIPTSLLNDPAKSQQVARMRRNYAFDRARNFLPVAATTNMMIVMSARGWIQLCQYLLSHPLPEANLLGNLIRKELELVTPHILKHATRKESFVRGIMREMDKVILLAQEANPCLEQNASITHPDTAYFEALLPPGSISFSGDLAFHNNRYAWIGSDLQRSSFRFGWEAVGIAEIRDLNRHRTGTKYCPPIPKGFYWAADQMPEHDEGYFALGEFGRKTSLIALNTLRAGDVSHVYWNLLGTQLPFEHVTTGDKFVYEGELRTGAGAHFRYAKHLRNVLTLSYQKFPELKEVILEGTAEPE